jgi:hypothetical protein
MNGYRGYAQSPRLSVQTAGEDFPEHVRITKANMLYLEKEGFSQKALNTVQRLAAFKNPDFYKAQAMRLPTRNKPRIISLSVDVDCASKASS